MAEGDSIVRMARLVESAFEGRAVDTADAPNPRSPLRSAASVWSDAGSSHRDRAASTCCSTSTATWSSTTHMGMVGGWYVYRPGPALAQAAAVLPGWSSTSAGSRLVQFGGPTLRLVRAGRAEPGHRLALLGPDILGGERSGRGRRGQRVGRRAGRLGEALLNQRLVAGIGNIFKSEACFEAGVDPWRPVETSGRGARVASVVETAAAADARTRRERPPAARPVYRRTDACPTCGGSDPLARPGR